MPSNYFSKLNKQERKLFLLLHQRNFNPSIVFSFLHIPAFLIEIQEEPRHILKIRIWLNEVDQWFLDNQSCPDIQRFNIISNIQNISLVLWHLENFRKDYHEKFL